METMCYLVLVYASYRGHQVLNRNAYKNIFLKNGFAKKCAGTLQKEAFCEHKVTVSEKGVSESTQNSNCHFNWDAIDKVEYNESYLFIYNTPATAFVIPKGSQAKRFSGI